MAIFVFRASQKISADIEPVWDFISSPANLKQITPEHMGFDIISEDIPEKMYPGMIISYHVKPLLGIKTLWVTEITHVKEMEYFVDEQRVGPYSLWHHEHHLKRLDDGVLMEDIVSYKPPFGILGTIANALFIKRMLRNIFDYRTIKLEERFGKYPER